MLHACLITVFAGLMLVFSPALHAATISGTIKFDGEAPKFKEIKMDADPVCLTHHTEAVFPQTLILGDGNTMANVFVTVKGGLKPGTHAAPTEEVVVDQKGCQYYPHVVAIMAGQPVKVL